MNTIAIASQSDEVDGLAAYHLVTSVDLGGPGLLVRETRPRDVEAFLHGGYYTTFLRFAFFAALPFDLGATAFLPPLEAILLGSPISSNSMDLEVRSTT